MSKHTPGPWQRPYQLSRVWGVYSPDGANVAKTAREADAALIAAAPDLLAAAIKARAALYPLIELVDVSRLPASHPAHNVVATIAALDAAIARTEAAR